MAAGWLRKYGKLKAAEAAIGLPVASARAYGRLVHVWATNGKQFWWNRKTGQVARWPRQP